MSCGCTKPCGCGDNVERQQPACTGFPSCDNAETCSETIDSHCTLYTGPKITNLNIPKGARVDEIIQRLVGAVVNPGCNYPTSPCKSAIVQVDKITTNTIKLSWGAAVEGASYVVEFRLPDVVNWSANASTTALYDTVGGLAANTEYYMRVQTICGGNSCYSLTFSITTKT